MFDFDNDGDLDLLVVNQEPYSNEDVGITFQGTRLFRNDNDSENNWLKIKLEGIQSESSGIGSRLEAYVGGKLLVREIYGGGSHESQNTTIAHFGLSDHQSLDSLIVKWSGGNTQVLTEVSANQVLKIEEEPDETQNPSGNGEVLIYPNAFREEITVSYQLPEGAIFDLIIYDALGREVSRLLESSEGSSGNYIWQVPEGLAPGFYFFVLRTDKEAFVAKGVKK